MYDALERDEKRALWHSIIKEIRINNDQQVTGLVFYRVYVLILHYLYDPPGERYLHYIDIHSHNSMEAKVSPVDGEDERATRIYIVVGRLDKFFPDVTVRMSCGGTYLEMDPGCVLESFGAVFPQEWRTQVTLIRKSAIRALEAVLVRFEKDRCPLTSTNLDTYLSVELPAQCDNFAFLLGRPRETARAFRQLEGQLALEQIETGGGQTKLALSCGPRSAVLSTFLPEDFPKYPHWEMKRSFAVNADRLYGRVEQVRYAVGIPCKKDTDRACRINIQFSGNRVYAVDGYRMAWDIDPELDVPHPSWQPRMRSGPMLRLRKGSAADCRWEQLLYLRRGAGRVPG